MVAETCDYHYEEVRGGHAHNLCLWRPNSHTSIQNVCRDLLHILRVCLHADLDAQDPDWLVFMRDDT